MHGRGWTVRDGEKGPVEIEMLRRRVQTRIERKRTGPEEWLVVTRRPLTEDRVLCQEGWPLRQQDWPFGLQETRIGQRKVFQEEDAGLGNRII